MKKNITVVAVAIGLAFVLFISFSFTKASQSTVEYAQVTALETQIAGGAGRSRLVITYPDGKQEVSELSNYKSLVGINFDNVFGNERAIVAGVKKMTDQGYEIRWVESGVSEGIYITKYIMAKK